MALQTMPDSAEIMATLRGLERDCAARAATLLSRRSAAVLSQGVVFRAGSTRMLASIESVGEVLDFPRQITAVPGAPRWVVGVANHRGGLLPLYDLKGLLFRELVDRRRGARALILPSRKTPMGLLVEDVIGMRRFRLDPAQASDADFTRPLSQILLGLFHDGTQHLPVVDLGAVQRLPAFSDVRFGMEREVG